MDQWPYQKVSSVKGQAEILCRSGGRQMRTSDTLTLVFTPAFLMTF